MTAPARYYMIGGFLGAGKTTAVAALGRHLAERGQRVGLITNDQGNDLADSALLRARGFAIEEISGGCFCCRFNSLMEAARKLTESARPDAFVAEPVGSCTDLIATVSYPLRRMHGDHFELAPLSVLVDPFRAEQALGLREGRKFSEKVLYIWRKQVEEADLVVIAKRDLLDERGLDRLRDRLGVEFPGKPVMAISAKLGAGLVEWFERIERERAGSGASMDVDYDVYSEGEALLGWLNATVQATASAPLDSGAWMQALAERMQAALGEAEIAHLKMTFSPDDGLTPDVAALSVVRSGVVPELTLKLPEPTRGGQLIVNCRAEADPNDLRDALKAALAEVPERFPGLSLRMDHVEHFRPGRPQPTHRFDRLDSPIAQ